MWEGGGKHHVETDSNYVCYGDSQNVDSLTTIQVLIFCVRNNS